MFKPFSDLPKFDLHVHVIADEKYSSKELLKGTDKVSNEKKPLKSTAVTFLTILLFFKSSKRI